MSHVYTVHGGTPELETIARAAGERGDDYRIVYDEDERIIAWIVVGDDIYENGIVEDERDDLYWSEDALAEAENYWRQ